MRNTTSKLFFGSILLCCSGLVLANETTSTPPVPDSPSVAAQLEAADYGQSGELILQLWLRQDLLNDGLLALVRGGDIYLPLGEISRALELAIYVDAQDGSASGWFLTPNQGFELNTQEKIVRLEGKDVSIKASDVLSEEGEDDLFVRMSLLSQWLPLNFHLELRAQRLVVRSQEKLPIELAKAREERYQKGFYRTYTYQPRKPYITPSYRFLDWPVASIRAGTSWGKDRSPRQNYSARLFGDLAFLNGELYASGDDDGLRNARLSLGRYDPNGRVFGLGLVSEFKLGDTYLPLTGAISSSISGRGLRIGNRSLNGVRDFNRIDLDGTLPEGYEVELYVNNRLLSVHRDRGTGQYLFSDVPLQVGQNEIRLEFYGQQGQRETQIRRTFVGASDLEAGTWEYEFALIEPERTVFDNYIDQQTQSLESRTTSDDAVDAALNARVGLGGYTSLGFTAASLAARRSSDLERQKDDSQQGYFSLDLSTEVSGVYGVINTSVDNERDLAGGITVGTSRGAYRLNAQHQRYSQDFDPLSDENDNKANSGISLSRDYRTREFFSDAWGIGLNHDLQFDDSENLDLNARYDLRWKSIYLTSIHNYSTSLSDDQAEDSLTGQLNVSWHVPSWKAWHFRSEFDYGLRPERELDSASLSFGRSFGNFHNINFRVTDRKGHTDYQASWRKRFKYADVDVGVSSDDTGDYSASISVAFEMGRYPGRNKPYVRSYDGLTGARVGVVAFVDENQNYQRDDGERGVPGVQVLRNALSAGVETNSEGYGMLSGLSSSSSVDLSLNPATVTDLNLSVQALDHGILPRPGRLPVMELPLFYAADLEGEVQLQKSRSSKRRPAPNVKMLLTSTATGKVYESHSEYDGVFFFSNVPEGRYQLKPDPTQMAAIRYQAYPAERLVTLDVDNESEDDFSFVLKPNGGDL